MNVRQTIELAALCSAYSPHVIEGHAPLPQTPVRSFWHYARQNQTRWASNVKQLPVDGGSSAESARVLFSEMFAADVLTRVWSAVLTAADRARGVRMAEPLVRQVLVDHLETRREALAWMLRAAEEKAVTTAAEVNRFRRRCERWTDVLLAPLVTRYNLDEFAFDDRRARDFATLHQTAGSGPAQWALWDMILAGLRIAFPTQDVHNQTAVRVEQRAVTGAILATIPRNAFTAEGPLRPVLVARIARSCDRALQTKKPVQTAALPPLSFAKLRRKRDEN